MYLQELLEFGQVVGLLLFLMPIVIGCTLFVIIIWMIIRNKRNETDKRTQIALAAIEKNPNIDVEELLEKMAPKRKSLREKQANKLQRGIILSLVGFVFVGLGAFLGYEGGGDPDDPVIASVFGFIFLAVGIAFFINYYITKKMLAKEIEAEERELTKLA
jgi:hypothetical protein